MKCRMRDFRGKHKIALQHLHTPFTHRHVCELNFNCWWARNISILFYLHWNRCGPILGLWYHQSENKRLLMVCDPPRAQRRRRQRLESKTWPLVWMVFTLCFFFSVSNECRIRSKCYALHPLELLSPPLPSTLHPPPSGAQEKELQPSWSSFVFFPRLLIFPFEDGGLVVLLFFASFINLVCEFFLSPFRSFLSSL